MQRSNLAKKGYRSLTAGQGKKLQLHTYEATMQSQLFSDLKNPVPRTDYNTKGYHKSPTTYAKKYKNAASYDHQYHYNQYYPQYLGKNVIKRKPRNKSKQWKSVLLDDNKKKLAHSKIQ